MSIPFNSDPRGVTRDQLLAERAFVGLSTMYGESFRAVDVSQVALILGTPLAMNAIIEQEWWAEPSFRLRKWVGEREYQSMVLRSKRNESTLYEGSCWLDWRKYRNNQLLDEAAAQAQEMGRARALHPARLFYASLKASRSTIEAWDGQTFYDTDHPVNYDKPSLGTYANSFTFGLTAANLKSVVQAMSTIPSPEGDLVINQGVRWVLHVPWNLGDTAASILGIPLANALDGGQPQAAQATVVVQAVGANGTGGGSTNVLQGLTRLIIDGNLDLDDPARWYLHGFVGNMGPYKLKQLAEDSFRQLSTIEEILRSYKAYYGMNWDGVVYPTLPNYSATSKASS